MTKLIIFNFDGTCNEAEDAEQKFDNKGAIEDENITNILKFHLLCGGNLKRTKPQKTSKQISLYYSGVGTYGNFFQRLYNTGLSKDKFDVAKILREALTDFDNYYKPGDKVLLTGFSRGAALARRFASLINGKVNGDDIIEAVFDTVASIGLPNMKKSERPKSEVVFENGHTLPAHVKQALHCLSLDDKRKAFQPTLMNTEKKIHELWFAGAHSDVGGGYYYDGLADIAFRYMLNWVDELDWQVNILTPTDIAYDDLLEKEAGFKISHDDVSIDPDFFGKSHEQARTPLIHHLTLTDRACVVIEHDRLTNIPPLVHHSVSQRIAGDTNYKPHSLKGVLHNVIYDDGATHEFNGMLAHKENVLNRLNILTPDEQVNVAALAHQQYNHTGLYLEKDAEYMISVKRLKSSSNKMVEQKWRDGSIECDANGWDRAGVKLGIQEIAIAGMESFRRVPEANWFCLCGSIGNTDDTAFKIGKKKQFKATHTGELCLFANDLDRYYGNNFGKLIVHVKRIS